jgi:hypothetical protein
MVGHGEGADRQPFTARTAARRTFHVGLNAFCLGILTLGMFAYPRSMAKPPVKIDYNRDIRPVLDKCLSCHGHDPKAIQAGLRLDNRIGAIKLLDDGNHAIVPGHPEKSELMVRINEKDPAMLMPPPSSNRVLSEEDKAVLKAWIEQGAEYKQHWAFVKPVRPAVPRVALKAWPKNPIDNFILERLEAEGLNPSKEADKETLLRRVSLDLTGLPPSPGELKNFLADKSPSAYEKVVDRLLASPRYGERMAMDWVDCARYADSNGYQNDYERYQYRWRDWVIDAFNKNMPYDEFTIEQLAGDLLPNPTLDQIIATGFCRNNRLNTEGGAIPEEYHVEYVIDRVQTVSAVWLGLTTGCARCHDHKYDPISQKEFYSLCSYFNNVPETDIGEERPTNYPPLVKAPYPDQAKKLSRLTMEVAALQKQSADEIAAIESQAQAWREPNSDAGDIEQGRIARYQLGPEPKAIGAALPQPKDIGPVKSDLGRSTGSIRTDDKSYVDVGPVGDFERNGSFSYGAWIRREGDSGSPLARMDEGNDYRGWDLNLTDGKPTVHIIHQWPQNAIKVIAKSPFPKAEWTHIFVTYDGSAKASGIHIYVNGTIAPFDVDTDRLSDTIRTPVDTHIGRRSGTGAVFTGDIDDPALYDRELSPAEVKQLSSVSAAHTLLAIPLKKRTEPQRQSIAREWLLARDDAFKKLEADRQSEEKQKVDLDASIPTVMVMKEMPKPRDAFVLLRGIYDHHGDKVTATTPAFLPPMPAGVPNNRLGLAKWIVSPDNPLTSRVTVNRMWERLFGTGIVETSEDFGTRSSFPSHPELLDWLATELIARKWNIKALWKEMVMSATYRQASAISPKLLALDPANRLLARGPRFRLPAEVIRDQAMYAGGFLTEKIGGPSVYPYQPKGIWDELAGTNGNLRNYKNDTGPNLHRRSLYTIWKRTAAPPDMVLFDVPSREICTVRRARTDTPLQALVLMNDVTFVEASRGLAQRMLREGGPTPASRIDLAFRLVLGRDPAPIETDILTAATKREVTHYQANPKAAAALLKSGDLALDTKANPVELAAYTLVASTILNMDETVTKR